jgi:transketolase N-terminal domain/subunit
MNKVLHKRILEISFQENLSHIGSCLTAVDIIDKIYNKMLEGDKFILSSGHAGLALYCVLEKNFGHDAIQLLHDHGIHPCKDIARNIICSTGSLGQGITVAIGHAIANPRTNVYVLCSDGECAEGSLLESIRFLIENPQITNIKIYINSNGFGAYKTVDNRSLYSALGDLIFRGTVSLVDTTPIMKMYEPILKDLSAHYKTLKKEEFEKLCLI